MASREPNDQMQQALALHQAGRREEAEAIYRQILARDPGSANAMHYLGLVLHQKRQFAEAWELMRQAIAIDPSQRGYYSNAVGVLLALGQNDEAIAACRRALTLRPTYAAAFYGLGRALISKGCHGEATAAFRKAVELNPKDARAWNALGLQLVAEAQADRAVECFRSAAAANPTFADAFKNLGQVLWDMDRLDEALAAFRQALSLEPDSAQLRGNIGYLLVNMGEVEEAIALYREAIELKPTPDIGSRLLFALHLREGMSPGELREEHRTWNARFARPLGPSGHALTNDRTSDRRLRIGYLSSDFCSHPVGRFLLPLFAKHDHSAFEVFCYSDVRSPDEVTELLRSRADGWREVRGMPDEQLAELIRHDRVDILVDLAMHVVGNRMLVFARKPAPVQVTYLAYPGTTGLEAMDYRLTDPHLDPPGRDESVYSETSVRLRSFWCYQPASNTPALAPPPALARGQVTLGCLNNFCKVTPGALTAWCKILRRVPNSRLLLHVPKGSYRERTADRFAAERIEPNRVEFIDLLPPLEHLAQYGRIDIALDPFPYPGGTTTCDALWMGVPVVSLAGETAISRGGLSILSNIGLPELVGQTVERYIEIVVQLAQDLPLLLELRGSLRDRMGQSPLMDASGFTKDVERAYRMMWTKWCGSRVVR